jgi:predicted Zn-dependent peptidase
MSQLTKALSIFCMSITLAGVAQKKYTYQSVKNDPINTRIYTLDNGLTVYLAANKEEPRIQTYVGVRAGGKDDPAQTTGLAHYFEHMMFKGTPNFGTTNWAEEKKLLDQIEAKFEVYRKTTDPEKRKELYKEIDRISHEASKLAIPNEYDKLMTAIGSTGTNAFTGLDYTAYVENIPSNQIENWAKIQYDRFTYPVLRLFHTELETVYEEKNMSLTQDARKSSEAMLKALFPNHPYGTQTVLGHPEHLKNPSMTDINAFHKKYYVASNMCVVMAGDFDYDQAIQTIDEYFGKLERGNAPKFKGENLLPLTENKYVDVMGQEAENVTIAFRTAPFGTTDSYIADVLAMMLSNGKAGLIDLNLNKKQKTLGARAGTWTMIDHGSLSLSAGKKEGQTLEEVKDLLLEQLDLIKKGQFDEWLISAAANNLKLNEIRGFDSNGGRARSLVFAFMNRRSWDEVLSNVSTLSKITKQQIVNYANTLDKHIVIYKRKGAATDIPIVDKPAITPNFINRDSKSAFLVDVEKATVSPISPKFVDFKKDMSVGKLKNNVDILYKQNTDNGLFQLAYYFPMGSDNDKNVNLAANYLRYLGTSKMTSEQVDQEFYKIACSYSVTAGRDETYISLSGLAENQEKAVSILEALLADAQVNEKAYANLVKDILKTRKDNKGNQRANWSALTNYALYGSDSPQKHQLSEAELNTLNPQVLVDILKNLNKFPHEVLYYGPTKMADVSAMINKLHNTPAKFNTIPQPKVFKVQDTNENQVIFAHYKGPQSQVQSIINGVPFNNDMLTEASVYNDYFGGGMNAIVFQELREKRGLAYSAWARYAAPTDPKENFRNLSFIQTQNDKVVEALDAFNDLFDNMPKSETAFNLTKESMMSNMRTQRTAKMNVIWNYLENRKMGRDYDLNEKMYKILPSKTLNDAAVFSEKHVKGKAKTYVILGNEELLNFAELEKKYGKVTKVKAEDYFGY